MKKAIIYNSLFIISALLAVAFAVHTIVDSCKYDSMLTSFPFYVFIIIHAVKYFIPSIIVLIIALILKKKFSNREKK